ncbi:predicted protein [Streptomyces viridosporus ATCC 14672]|uniref:Predicted protein n=1 Tax=Streptomyces viridosporus (strain ATCC 14672 / DSM 40746 / JCM 4963 / KCTC 9882 / NRRL B-12104 / FH 1290) TaxID=566461 RepID=D6A1H0_STRV1|nr:predicted protein [Streptomyces viridosporus ATCC 14672]
MNPDRPAARAVGIHHGRIIGPDDESTGVRGREEVDLLGTRVVPGSDGARTHAPPGSGQSYGGCRGRFGRHPSPGDA